MNWSQQQVEAHNARVMGHSRDALVLEVGRPPKPDAGEAKVRAQILEYCKAREWLVFTGSTAHRTKRTLGEFDATVCLPGGIVLFCEIKGKGGKPTQEQRAIAAWLKKLNHHCVFAWTLVEFIDAAAAAMAARVQEATDCFNAGKAEKK